MLEDVLPNGGVFEIKGREIREAHDQLRRTHHGTNYEESETEDARKREGYNNRRNGLERNGTGRQRNGDFHEADDDPDIGEYFRNGEEAAVGKRKRAARATIHRKTKTGDISRKLPLEKFETHFKIRRIGGS